MKRCKLVCLALLIGTLTSPSGAAIFRGVVLSPDGAPVAGAQVWVGPVRLHEYSVANGTLRQITTGADGRFTAEFPDSVAASAFAFTRVLSEKWALRDVLLEAGQVTENRINLDVRKGVGGRTEPFGPKNLVRLRYMGYMDSIAATGKPSLYEETAGSISLALWVESLPVLETTSNEQGQWEFAQVNNGLVRVESETYGTSIIHSYQDPDSPGAVRRINVKLKASVDIEGDIVDSDGAPLAGVVVTYGWFATPLARSDAKGHFILRRVARDEMHDPLSLRAVVPGSDWLLSKREVPLQRIPTIIVPRWQATRGMEISGQAIDAVTGAALPGVTVGSATGGWRNADNEGRISVRLPIGETLVAHAENYRVKRLPINRGTAVELGKVEMQRIVTVRGLLVDDKGKAVSGVSLTGRGLNENYGRTTNSSDQSGFFELKLGEGQTEISCADRAWQLMPEKTPVLVARDMASLRLVVRPVPFHEVRGRVVTAQGQPVAKARVLVMVKRPPEFKSDDSPEFAEGQAVSTKADGRYVARFGGPFEAPRVEARREGFCFRNSKTSAQVDKNGDWLLPDVSMAALTGQVRGRVLTRSGQPAVGAVVICPETEQFAATVCDQQGRFMLPNVPEDSAVLMAAQGKDFFRLTVRPGVEREAVLRLTAPRLFPETERRRLLSGKVPDIWNFLRYWDALGTATLLTLALQGDGALPPGEMKSAVANWSKSGKNVLTLMGYAAARDPLWLRKNGPTFIDKIPPRENDPAWKEVHDNATYKLALVNLWGDDTARLNSREWLTKQLAADVPESTNGAVWKNALRWFRCAGIAAGLGDDRAASFVANGINWLERAQEYRRDRLGAGLWGEALSPGGPSLLSLLKSKLSLTEYAAALGFATQRLAKLDWRRASAIHALSPPLLDEAKQASEREASTVTSNLLTSSRRGFFALLLARAENDPQGALQQLEDDIGMRRIKRIPFYDVDFGWGVRVVVVREALRRKQTTVAAQALRPALQKPPHFTHTQLAHLAAIASRFDGELASKFWSAAHEKLPYAAPYELSQYAVHRAPFDPPLSRLQLEWCAAIPPEIYEIGPATLAESDNCSEAFVTVNFQRALEQHGYNDDKPVNLSARFITHLLTFENHGQALMETYDGLLP